ncbi:MAG: polysaccharide biosynthesis tyrosine autokinase [Vicinamibacteria bacterium]
MNANSPVPVSELGAGFSPDSGTSTLRREFGVLARGRYLVAGCVLCALGVVALYNFGARPLYEAVSVVSLDEAGISPLSTRYGADITRKAAALDEQFRLLKSPELALVAVGAIGPVVDAELAQGPLGGWEQRIKDAVRFRLGLTTKYGTALPERVASFRSRLSVDYEPPSKWVYVRFRAYDPDAAALAVNRLLDVYLAEAAKQTEGAVGALRKQLDEQVAERQEKTSEVFTELDAFEKREGLQGADARRELLGKELSQLQDSLVTARQARLARQAMVEEAERSAPGDLVTLPSIREDRDVREIAARIADTEVKIARGSATLGERHPDILALQSELESAKGQMSERVKSLRSVISLDYRMAVRSERDILTAMQIAQQRQSGLQKGAIEHSFIQKQAEAGQKAVGELIDKSARESDAEVFFAPTILQKATPNHTPVSPQTGKNFQYALAIGLGLGLALAWLASHLDETVKTPDDIKTGIGLPLLGMVPRARVKDLDLFLPEDGPSTRLFEAYRVLRTNLLQGDRSPQKHRLVLVTSSREGEGKTTTTCGLGITLARAGLRVLLIDGDLRRTSLSNRLSATKHPGLTDAALGKRTVQECITRTAVKGLDVLPCGVRLLNPAEMLNHESLASVIDGIRREYDWILCDAPPVLAVADAAILCRLADSVLLVVGANTTPVGSVQAALEQLSAVGANVWGVVLNSVDLARDSHYYKYYYSSHYDDYSKSGKRLPAKFPSRPLRPTA